MPKQKTRRSAVKRFRVTANGKVVRGHSMKSHILTKKTTGRKRHLRKPGLVSKSMVRTIRALLLK